MCKFGVILSVAKDLKNNVGYSRGRIANQKGATLITCIVLITACILFATVAIENTLLEFRGKANYLQKIETLNLAENTLAEIKLQLGTLEARPIPESSCSHLSCINLFRILSEEELTNLNWWEQVAIKAPSQHSEEESYIFIQELAHILDHNKESSTAYYQVLILSRNKKNDSLVILKGVFLKFFDAEHEIAYPALRVSWQQVR